MSNGKTRVLFVCYGNICRSPMAEFVFRKLLDERGLDSEFDVQSAGTNAYEGESPDSRAREELRLHGISCDGKRSQRLTRSHFRDFDYIIAMDSDNLYSIRRICPGDAKCRIGLLLDYAEGGEIEDPYYSGGFDVAYSVIRHGCECLLDRILEDGR